MDRWKKLLQQNMTSMECEGDARRLAEIPREAAEVLERNSEAAEWGEGVLTESVWSKHQPGLPSLQHQTRKGTQITSNCEKQQGVCLPKRDSWSHREPLKGPRHIISFAVPYLGLQQSGDRVD